MPSQQFNQGDLVWLDFDPQAGHEQGKRRPGLIVSGLNALALIKTVTLVCPISGHTRDFPTHVALDERTKTEGLIMCEQVKAMDLDVRNAIFIERVPEDILMETLDILHSMLD